jgi:3-hydroxyisobutyrate dehydrogenase-like beta-hydroxyacid dehydrogenase
MTTVGLVGTGAMGSALGARLRDGGCRVVVGLAGRSGRSRRLAAEAGLEDVGSLEDVVRSADVVLSVVPPEAALAVVLDVTRAAAAVSAAPPVADLNAIAPATAHRLADALAEAGLDLVDGSISGPPPTRPGTTRVYLSGARAAEVAALPAGGVELRVVGGEVGLASAVKMCTASVYKGRVALLAQALRTAHANGVLEPVLDDLVETGVADRERSGETLARASAKAWRYIAEMEEIAATQAAAGLTPALFEALAEVYRDLASRAVADAPEEIATPLPLRVVLEAIAQAGPASPAR